jgi:hypothetical protein
MTRDGTKPYQWDAENRLVAVLQGATTLASFVYDGKATARAHPRERTYNRQQKRTFSREGNEPPHVHVRKGDAIAKLWLQPVCLAFSEGFNPPEIRRLRQLTFEHQIQFLERWHEYLGR